MDDAPPDMPDTADAPPLGLDGPEDRAGYTVLARKYRPSRFEDLIGQEAMVKTLTNAFASGRIAHAYMLTGVRGVGKTTTARLIARALNYKTSDVDKPSIVLDPPGEHCAAIQKSAHVDILEMDAASRTGVGDIREILEGVRYAPVSARYKVYVIDEVHMLSTSAFNALLKTLEEPPPHVKFIFATTEIRKVPVTVLSRCQRFDLKRVDRDELAAHLKGIAGKEGATIEGDALALIARAAEGSVRDALSLLDQAIVQGSDSAAPVTALQVRDMLGLADRARVLDLLEAALSGDHAKALAEIADLYDAGADPAVVTRDCLDFVHAITRVKVVGEGADLAEAKETVARLAGIAEGLSLAQLTRLFKILLTGLDDVRQAPEPLSAAEMTLLRLSSAASLPSPEDAARMIAEGMAGKEPAPAPKPDAPSGAEPDAPASQHRDDPLQSRRETPPEPVVAETEPVAPDEVVEGPKSFDQLMALLERKRDIRLKSDVERFVRPVSYKPGSIVYEPVDHAPPDLAQRLSRALSDWTGATWAVLPSKDSRGGETWAERRKRERRELFEVTRRDPAVAEVLKHFPDAELVDVRSASEDDEAVSDDEDQKRERS
ncbi:MAG: DNA polymerase III subunit gamma/tau [Maricaulis sp.]|jgi:DNA polymerase-3 subunit gamma/tau|nr:DNA polymerase III subunit gamma/tau [Maricaulis sp.]HAQ33984.1 DNA polymerase III subunit gamma/tau [Alphaproteobacteria bacterium]